MENIMAALRAKGGMPPATGGAPMGMPPAPGGAPTPPAPVPKPPMPSPPPPAEEEKKKEPAKSSASDLDKAISLVASILDKMDKKSEASTILANAIRSMRDARPMLKDETPPKRATEKQGQQQAFKSMPKTTQVEPFGSSAPFKGGNNFSR